MKRIVCYGDSNTHGYDPETGFRYDEQTRWTRLLQAQLGPEFEVIEEGYNGRTVDSDDPEGIMKNGETYLYPCIRTHCPVDLVILMLGTNDLKSYFHKTVEEIGAGIEKLIPIIRQASLEKHPQQIPAKILLMAPPLIGEGMEDPVFGKDRAYELSLSFADVYEKISQKYDTYYLNAAEVTKPSTIDHLHLDAEGHKKMGAAIAKKVMEIYGIN